MTDGYGYMTQMTQAGSALGSQQKLAVGMRLASSTQGTSAVAKDKDSLRQTVDDVVGQVFYGTLLQSMRSSVLKCPLGHGGRGEDVFAGQLDMLLSQQAGRASRFSLNEAIYRSMARKATGSASGGNA